MVFLIQRSQDKDAVAIRLKLEDLTRARCGWLSREHGSLTESHSTPTA
jgi:hypothetical protein